MAKRSRSGFRERVRAVSRRRWAAITALVVVLAGAGAWFTMASGDDDGTEAQRITSTVARGTYKTTVSATGTITPKREEDLSFSSAGTVTSVRVAVGDRVVKGDVLAAIDKTALVAQRDAAESAVDAAETQLSEDAGSSSTQIAADEASLAAAKSQLASAQDAVDDATLRAPFSGTVSAVGYEVGDSAGAAGSSGGSSPSADGSSSAAITVISPKKLLVEATVSASDVSRLKKGLQAEITPTGGTETVYGIVTEVGVIAAASDSGAAQFPVTVEVTGTPTGMYPGASATVAIVVKQATDVLAVPTAAVKTDDDGTSYVNLVVDGRTVQTPVTLGDVYGAQTEVTDGVKVGDVVEVVTITGRRGTGNGNGGGNRSGVQFPGGGELPGGGAFPGGGTGGGPQFSQGG